MRPVAQSLSQGVLAAGAHAGSIVVPCERDGNPSGDGTNRER